MMNDFLTIGECIEINSMLDNGMVGMDEDGHLVSPNEPICVESIVHTKAEDGGEPITYLKCHFRHDDYCIGYFDDLNLECGFLKTDEVSILSGMPNVRKGKVYMFRSFTSNSGHQQWLFCGEMQPDINWSQTETVSNVFNELFGCKYFPIIFQEEEE